MKVWTFSIAWNEARMAPWFLRHYAPWVERMVIWCEPSTDGTESILRACPKVDLRPWPHRGLDDEAFLAIVNSAYKEARGRADWVAFVDMDELLYHPAMTALLESCQCDVLPSTGYALISKTGWPQDDGHSQLYELVRTGVHQPNYDKKLLHRPRLDFVHAIGRHAYAPQWPRHNGRECPDSAVRLFHCHHVGGVEDTAARNARNYDRAIEKKFAWNFAPGVNDNPRQPGSVAWVKHALDSGALRQVL